MILALAGQFKQVRGSYLHLISNTALHITFLCTGICLVDSGLRGKIIPKTDELRKLVKASGYGLVTCYFKYRCLILSRSDMSSIAHNLMHTDFKKCYVIHQTARRKSVSSDIQTLSG